MQINFGVDIQKILMSLAEEDSTSVESLLTKLIKEEDEERHSVWSRKAGKHVRVRCPRRKCQEIAIRNPSDIAD